ncbi:MAG: hypothetical protein HY738_17665 [Bacteroidia bacterium]|nr:hypothetical protein [Bacteroidia bacterium]
MKIAENMQRIVAPSERNICSPAIHGGVKERREYSVAGTKAIRSRMEQRRKADK